MFLTIIITITHLLPPDTLGVLGVLSDHVSDISPTIIRPLEHVLFTMLLN